MRSQRVGHDLVTEHMHTCIYVRVCACISHPFFNFYLFGRGGSELQHLGSLILVAACGMKFPNQGSNPDPLH